MRKQKIWMVLGLAVVLIAALVVCGCMNMSASFAPPVSHSNEGVMFKGVVSSVTISPHSALNRIPAYVVSGGEAGGTDFAIGNLGDARIVIRDPLLIEKMEDLRKNPGRYCEIMAGQVTGTEYWEITDITVSA